MRPTVANKAQSPSTIMTSTWPSHPPDKAGPHTMQMGQVRSSRLLSSMSASRVLACPLPSASSGAMLVRGSCSGPSTTLPTSSSSWAARWASRACTAASSACTGPPRKACTTERPRQQSCSSAGHLNPPPPQREHCHQDCPHFQCTSGKPLMTGLISEGRWPYKGSQQQGLYTYWQLSQVAHTRGGGCQAAGAAVSHLEELVAGTAAQHLVMLLGDLAQGQGIDPGKFSG